MTDIELTLNELTLEDKVRLVSGASAWRTHPIESAGVPVLKVSDGPNGVRGDGGVTAASFPVGICLASTWNSVLIEQLGKAIAEEAKSKNVQVVLGPTINIHRTPLGGRDFECYSEDPYLSGILAASFTDGLQKEGVGACVKHFVCNDSEFERHTISVEIDERTLREIYLRPFEIAIKRSRPWTLMASYNRINGVYACSHDHLVNEVLKGEWEYEGLVMSDWFAAKETIPNAVGGLDLEMPGPARVWGEELQSAVESGSVSASCLDDKVRRLLRVLDWSGRFENPDEIPEQSLDRPQHRSVAYQTAVEGMVLIKNESILPLDVTSVRKLALIGPNSFDFRIMGGGSSSLKPHYISTPYDALIEKLPDTEIVTSVGCRTHKYIPEPDRRYLSPTEESSERGLNCIFYRGEIGSEIVGQRVIAQSTVRLAGLGSKATSVLMEGYYTPSEDGDYEFGLLSTGRARMYVDGELLIDNWRDTEPGEAFFTQGTTERRAIHQLSEGESVEIKIEFETSSMSDMAAVRYGILPGQSADYMAEAVQVAADADAVLLLVGTNDDWETEGNDRAMLELPGRQDELIREILKVNPRTVVINNSGSPIAMSWIDEAKAVIQSWFAGQEYGNALVDLVLGKVNPSGKLPITFPKRLQDTPAYTSYPGEFGKVSYGEGLFVGYRWYDARDIDPLLAFGHGLSYTDFEFSDLSVEGLNKSGGEISFKLSNTGGFRGQEVAQVYIEPIDGTVARPIRELRAFSKIDLEAGEQKQISISLDSDAFAHWDVSRGSWVVDPGVYRIHVGASSRDLRLVGEVTL